MRILQHHLKPTAIAACMLLSLQGLLRPAAAQPTTSPADDLAMPAYVADAKLSGQIKSVGSSTVGTLLNRWSDEFRKVHPDVHIDVSGAGSGVAIPALVEGSAQLAPMSRHIKKEEVEAFKAKFGYEPLAIPVAIDALAVFVEKTNPAQRLTMKQLDGIFSATRKRGGPPVRTWGDLALDGPWKERRITLYGFGESSGVTGVFRELALANGDFDLSVQTQPGSSSVVQGVGADPAGIGYASIFFLTKRTKVLSLEGPDGEFYPPTRQHCLSGYYPLSRYLYIYVNKPPGQPLDPTTREFLLFICSRQGQEVASRVGNYPLTADLITAARKSFEQ